MAETYLIETEIIFPEQRDSIKKQLMGSTEEICSFNLVSQQQLPRGHVCLAQSIDHLILVCSRCSECREQRKLKPEESLRTLVFFAHTDFSSFPYLYFALSKSHIYSNKNLVTMVRFRPKIIY